MTQPRHIGSTEASLDIGHAWIWTLLFGIATAVLGFLALAWPARTIVIVAMLLGIQLVISGIFRAVHAFTAHGKRHRILNLLLGVLAVIVGIMCLGNAFKAVALLALAVGLYWIVNGALDLFVGLANRDLPNRWLTVAMGVLGVGAGAIVLFYPGISLLTLALVLGAWLIALGTMEVIAAFQLRSAESGGRPLAGGYA